MLLWWAFGRFSEASNKALVHLSRLFLVRQLGLGVRALGGLSVKSGGLGGSRVRMKSGLATANWIGFGRSQLGENWSRFSGIGRSGV